MGIVRNMSITPTSHVSHTGLTACEYLEVLVWRIVVTQRERRYGMLAIGESFRHHRIVCMIHWRACRRIVVTQRERTYGMLAIGESFRHHRIHRKIRWRTCRRIIVTQRERSYGMFAAGEPYRHHRTFLQDTLARMQEDHWYAEG
jgi:hypothetical protein